MPSLDIDINTCNSETSENEHQSKKLNFCLLTCEELPDLQSDFHALLQELKKRGYSAAPQIWSDASFDWKSCHLGVFCSTWDYTSRYEQFCRWLDQTSKLTSFINKPEILRWNMRKTYLQELERFGVPVIPTLWLENENDLALLLEPTWPEVVIKPSLGAGSSGMRAFSLPAQYDTASKHALHLLDSAPVMVQPRLASLDSYGETVMIYFDGSFSHAAHRPLAGHHASPETEMSCSSALQPTEKQMAVAENALRALPFEKPLYCRIDLVKGPAGEEFLLEMEMIEPSLFFGTAPNSVSRYADLLVRELKTLSL